jgi:periplasmic mercuric ion binding protein
MKWKLIALAVALSFAGTAQAETKVELKGTHLCCGACVRAAGAILKDAGVKGTCDQKTKIISIVADSDEAAQKALDALADGGFHGDTGNDKLKQKDDSGAAAGKVKSLTLTGIHNCCGQCNSAIKATLKKVEGVKGDTAKAKENTFEVTGDFDAEAVVKALNAAGFHVKVKK